MPLPFARAMNACCVALPRKVIIFYLNGESGFRFVVNDVDFRWVTVYASPQCIPYVAVGKTILISIQRLIADLNIFLKQIGIIILRRITGRR